MAYKASEKYGLGRRNRNSPTPINPSSEDPDLEFDASEELEKITTLENPIFVLFNPKSLNISAEELNASNIWTRKLTGLQLGTTFLKEYDTNMAVENITREEAESPNSKPYNKQVISFSIVRGGLLAELLVALQNYKPDTIITIDIHNQDINLIKDEMARLGLDFRHIIGASGHHLSKLEQQASDLEQTIKEVERQLKVVNRKLETLKHDLSKRPTSKSLLSELGEKQEEADTITRHLDEFLKQRKNYVTFNSVANENEDSVIKRIRNLYRVWQGEVAKRENMGNEHGVIDKEEIRLAEEKKRQEKLQRQKEQQEQVKLAVEKRVREEAEEKKRKEDLIPKVLGIRIW